MIPPQGQEVSCLSYGIGSIFYRMHENLKLDLMVTLSVAAFYHQYPSHAVCGLVAAFSG